MAASGSRRLLRDEIDPYPTGEDGDPITLIGPVARLDTRQEATMRVREKGKADGEHVHMGWDEGQAALAAGTHEIAEGSPSSDDVGDTAGDGGTMDGTMDGSGELDTKTRAELEAIATERGLDVSSAKTKADVIEALRAPR